MRELAEWKVLPSRVSIAMRTGSPNMSIDIIYMRA